MKTTTLTRGTVKPALDLDNRDQQAVRRDSINAFRVVQPTNLCSESTKVSLKDRLGYLLARFTPFDSPPNPPNTVAEDVLEADMNESEQPTRLNQLPESEDARLKRLLDQNYFIYK